jgi:hypothetical protein
VSALRACPEGSEGSLSSVALSSARVPSVYHDWPAPLAKGDISTLQIRGHFYFALTGAIFFQGDIFSGNHFFIFEKLRFSNIKK